MSDEAFTQAVREYSDTVYRVCLHICRNRSDAEDLTQNVFLKLYRHADTFRDEEHLKSWLIRVAVNEGKSHMTSPWYRRASCSIDDGSLEDAGVTFPSTEQSELFLAVMALPPKYRVVVHLYYYEDYTVGEIAAMLDLKETTVQTQLMRARKQLKTLLSEADYEF
ncbi:MAG: sigma-70 family RNA polymerase sigma factor [Clostridia bacterium]|nr:sigma-70 family RNA polymerase sigma factor [Clostridia bacterium]MBQ4396592.1 sigma-70 family RNA polymerase sigma factor [Clostridia bacterium]MBQ5544959.1 sigma-70 family RNA polymerase sigma factor [Clostridia bacterium]